MTFNVVSIVAKGVAVLDGVSPGWEHRVKLETFDIQYENKCILAQLYGHHLTGFKILGLGDGGDVTHGFRHNEYIGISGDIQYSELNAEWKRVISNRIR
jgi:hypothetical protein